MANNIDITVTDTIDISVDSLDATNVTVEDAQQSSFTVTSVEQNISVTAETPALVTIEQNARPDVSVSSVVNPKIVVGGVGGSGDLHYIFSQDIPSAIWTINHNLNKKPSVTVVSSSEQVVYGDVSYINTNRLTITFSAAFSGKAYLN